MRMTRIALVAVLLLAACAPPPPPAARRVSADEKSVETLIETYVSAWNARDEKAILRLYANDARMVTRLAHDHKVLKKKDLAGNLDYVLREQARAGLVLELQKPLRVVVKGESATAQALLRVSYTDQGRPMAVLVDQEFTLRREQYFWRIVREHPRPVGTVSPDPPPSGP